MSFISIFSSFELLTIFTITIIYFIIASYEDFKKKEVFNYINFSYVFITIMFLFITSLLNNDYNYLFLGIIGMVVGFFLGSLLFYIGMWGGGDAKFMLGFGASFGVLSSYFSTYTNDVSSYINLFLTPEIPTYLIIVSNILIGITIICIGLICFNLITKKSYSHLVTPGILLVLLLLSQVTSLMFFLPNQIQILTTFIFIMLLFALPPSSALLLGKSKFLSVTQIKEEILNDSILCLINPIKKSNKLILDYTTTLDGISNHHISILSKEFSSKEKFEVVKPTPYLSYLILVNFCIIVLQLLYSSITGIISVILQQMEFLIISFIVGGIYVFLVVIFYILTNFNKLLEVISYEEKLFYSLVLFTSVIVYFLSSSQIIHMLILLVLTITLFIFLYKCTKIVEQNLFVITLPVNKLAPGDWIVEDIYVDSKLLFKKTDFKLGVSEEQIEILKKYDDKISGVLVKSGIAFIPHLFVSFILLIIISLL